MTHSRIQDLKKFEEQIFDVIQEYLDHKEDYPIDSALLIDSSSASVSIDSPYRIVNGDKIPLSECILTNDDEIACDVINCIASKYVFVQ